MPTTIQGHTTIPELTDYEYNEICYNAASNKLISGHYISQVCDLLNKCGIEVSTTSTYDENVSSAVFKFQQEHGLNATGNLNTQTLQAIIYQADKMSDTVEDDEESADDTTEEKSELPKYNSFFDDNKYKMHRRNNKDIKIVFGNDSITKTIKNVFMMDVSLEVDTSGNPVSEIYQFVAQDIVESDEIDDLYKYT